MAGGVNGVRHVCADTTPGAVTELTSALRAALDGRGPAVCPMPGHGPPPSGIPAEAAVLGPGVALVVPTSGTTGRAKSVLLSATALRASATATHDRLGGPGHWLLALPTTHIAGIQVLVRSLLVGREPEVMDRGGGFRAGAFASAAAAVLRLDGAHYTALVPTQLSRLVDAGGTALDALRAFDAVLVGGAAASSTLLRRALDAGVRVVTTYGMTETAGGCVYDGSPLPGVSARINGSGLVELSGPVLAEGYWARPAETARAFSCGWFRTADLGRLDAEGRLEVLGRVDDLINTGGVKVSPAAVERVLAAEPGVAEACVVGLTDPEWGERVAAAVVPTSWGQPPPAEALRDAVRGALGSSAVPRVVRFLAVMPVRGPGKIDRIAVRAALTSED